MASSAPPLARLIEPSLDERWPADGLGSIAALMAYLPDPSELEPGAWVGVTASSGADGRLARFFLRRPQARLGVRCAALLAKGFEEVGAGRDQLGREIAWGRAPVERSGPVSRGDGSPGTAMDQGGTDGPGEARS